ncbi:hypothetical protein B0H10DRAFT_315253 [Mycena sp. CBHHK59/15]|nr:hypothetical protein B0H10DRAFT_315253 [Mycena sp. CBHHK59/15]
MHRSPGTENRAHCISDSAHPPLTCPPTLPAIAISTPGTIQSAASKSHSTASSVRAQPTRPAITIALGASCTLHTRCILHLQGNMYIRIEWDLHTTLRESPAIHPCLTPDEMPLCASRLGRLSLWLTNWLMDDQVLQCSAFAAGHQPFKLDYLGMPHLSKLRLRAAADSEAQREARSVSRRPQLPRASRHRGHLSGDKFELIGGAESNTMFLALRRRAFPSVNITAQAR